DQLEITNAAGVLRYHTGPIRQMTHCRFIRKLTGVARGPRLRLTSASNHRTFPAANFQLVAIGILEKEGVIAWAIASANFWPLELFPASVAHEFRNPIYFFARVGPKCDACAIRFVFFIWTKAKEFRRFAGDSGIKSMEVSTGLFVNESKLWQKFPVK